MDKMNKFVCVFIFFLSQFIALGNEKDLFLKDIKSYQDYLKKHALSISVNYKLYDKSLNNDFIQNTSISAKVIRDNLFIDNSNFIYYCNPKYSLTLFKERNLAVLSKTNKLTTLSKVLENMAPDSNFLSNVSKIDLISDTLGKRTYSIRFKDYFQYKNCILVFDKETNCVVKNTIYYNKNIIKDLEKKEKINEDDKNIIPIMVVDYKITEEVTSKEFFEAKDILAKSGKNFILIGKYKNFKLINQMLN